MSSSPPSFEMVPLSDKLPSQKSVNKSYQTPKKSQTNYKLDDMMPTDKAFLKLDSQKHESQHDSLPNLSDDDVIEL